jgi:DNA modification methylase
MTNINIEIEREFAKLEPDKDWSFKDVTASETNHLTHSYHRYPAKFIPNIVRKLIEDYTTTDNIVCDPFGGCGTTLVEAKLMGRKSIGFDINPIAKLITQTKITPLPPKRLSKTFENFKQNLPNQKSIVLQHNEKIFYWFDETTIHELDKLYSAIKKISDFETRRLFLCAFSHILKNCSKWLMKSIKPTIDKDKIIPSPEEVFIQHMQRMVKKNELFSSTLKEKKLLAVNSKMRLGDSTKKLPLKEESIDLVITSPPYVTSYEYADLHQLSLLWFGDDPSYFKRWNKYAKDYNFFRSKFVGTRHKKEKRGDYGSEIAKSIIEELAVKNKRIALNVSNYFIDMKKSFEQIHRVLKKRGKACIIIGNTSLRGVPINNAQVAAEQMKKTGFKKIEFIKREISSKVITSWRDVENGRFTSLKNSNKRKIYDYEYILIMEKQASA